MKQHDAGRRYTAKYSTMPPSVMIKESKTPTSNKGTMHPACTQAYAPVFRLHLSLPFDHWPVLNVRENAGSDGNHEAVLSMRAISMRDPAMIQSLLCIGYPSGSARLYTRAFAHGFPTTQS